MADSIETLLADKITAKDLANLIDVSMAQLFRAFRISFSVAPLRYVANRRVQHLCTILITTREPTSLPALAGGFFDQARLSKLFCRAVGMSPSARRRAMTARYVAPDAPREHRCQ
jgi:AraC family transcriptional regulator